MTYGLRIINDESELLIDSEYFSPTYVSKLEFNTTPTAEEAWTSQLHSGYVKRTYTTSAIPTAGNYIVMWTLPNNGTKDVWYNFESSTVNYTGVLTCHVYANSLGDPLNYYLPTGYLFTVSDVGVVASSGPALRLYNSNNVKTFDSNTTQLVPYSISDDFSFWTDPSGTIQLPTSITVPVANTPIFMLPHYTDLRVLKLYSGSTQTGHLEFVYEPGFRRESNVIYAKEFCSYYSDESQDPWPYTQTIYRSGNRSALGLITADTSIYAAPSPGTGGGSNPSYSLTANSYSVNEGQTVVITLTTSLVPDGSSFSYTVTGISSADLSSGGLTGSFVVYSNTATASFTFSNDLTTEGTETFRLSLDGFSQTVDVTVNDTSTASAVYSFADPSSINEGTTSSNTFSATNASNKVISFSVIAPSSGNSGVSDVTLLTSSFTPNSNSLSTISVSYSVSADSLTEGTEYFRLQASVNGSPVATSGNISINDTSTSPATFSITALNTPWAESATQYASITVTNYAGQYVYLNTNNGSVTSNTSELYIPNNNYTTTISYTVGDLPSTTNVVLYLRTESIFGTVQASSTVSVIHTPPAPTYNLYNTFNTLANGSSGTFFLRSTNAAGVTVTVSDNSARASVSPTSFTISSNATTDTYITVTATVPTTNVGEELVTITLSTGNSFPFTIPSYSISAPLVSSVTYLNGQTFYYAGETITALINFNGPVTPDTYIRVELNAGVYGTGNNVIVAGQNDSIGYLPIGGYTGYYFSPANPGIYNTTGKVGARAETSAGTIRQAYVYGSNVTLSTLPPP